MTWPIKSSGETKNIKTTQNSNQVMHIISNILILPKGLFSCHMGTSLVSKKTGMERCDLWSYSGVYSNGYHFNNRISQVENISTKEYKKNSYDMQIMQ